MSVTATITIRSFSSAIVITYLSHVVKQRVLCPSRLHRSRLFEPDSSGVFARHYSDEPSRRNVTAGRAYAGGSFAARAHATRKASAFLLLLSEIIPCLVLRFTESMKRKAASR